MTSKNYLHDDTGCCTAEWETDRYHGSTLRSLLLLPGVPLLSALHPHAGHCTAAAALHRHCTARGISFYNGITVVRINFWFFGCGRDYDCGCFIAGLKLLCKFVTRRVVNARTLGRSGSRCRFWRGGISNNGCRAGKIWF